ncbi:MAG: SH3 domain-containing protein [Chloroflexi bacterium]|nr:SH3 domain-containing protein [Chloroflexota bacterium]
MKIRVDRHLSAFYFGLILVLAACGGAPATATPVPASIVRPVQPTPVYGKSSNFTLSTPQSITSPVTSQAPIVPVTAITTTQPVVLLPTLPSPDLSTLQQPPSALGIVTGDAVLLGSPGGRVLVNLPSGATVTVTGKSADNNYLAVYTNDGVVGWVSAGQLLLFGADDLTVVQAATGPGLIATLIAQDMQPLTTTLATPAPGPADTVVITTANGVGIDAIISADRVNLREAPDVNATVMAKLNQADRVQIIGKNAAGDWLQIRSSTNVAGWVSAQFVQVGHVAQP